MRKLTALFWTALLLFVFSCSKNNTNEAIINTANTDGGLARNAFTVIPLDTNDITALVPLGNLNPPAHTFPADHMYFYCFTIEPSLNIKSPGNTTIFRIGRTRYHAGTPSERFDYMIAMGVNNSHLYLSHVNSISPRLQAAVNNFIGAKCQPPYSTGGISVEQCYLDLNLAITPGEVLGMVFSKSSWAVLDFGAVVNGTGTNPLEYFDAASRSRLESKLGRFDGKVKRTIPPLYGENMQDIITTAMGNWYKQGAPRTPEDNHIALVKDNIDPTKQAISAGNSLPGLPSGVYYFNPETSGFTNRNFAEVKADGNIYCYTLGIPNFPFPGNSLIPMASVIIRMENGTTLSAEKRNCDCICAPYQFTSAKITYTR